MKLVLASLLVGLLGALSFASVAAQPDSPSAPASQTVDDLVGDWTMNFTSPALTDVTMTCTAHIDHSPRGLLMWFRCPELATGDTYILPHIDSGDDGSYAFAGGVPIAYDANGAPANILTVAADEIEADHLAGRWEIDQYIGGPFEADRATFQWGDADCSGEVNILDALLILQFSLHRADQPVFLPCYYLSDMNLSGFVEPRDAFLVMDVAAGFGIRAPAFVGFDDGFCRDHYDLCRGR